MLLTAGLPLYPPRTNIFHVPLCSAYHNEYTVMLYLFRKSLDAFWQDGRNLGNYNTVFEKQAQGHVFVSVRLFTASLCGKAWKTRLLEFLILLSELLSHILQPLPDTQTRIPPCKLPFELVWFRWWMLFALWSRCSLVCCLLFFRCPLSSFHLSGWCELSSLELSLFWGVPGGCTIADREEGSRNSMPGGIYWQGDNRLQTL